MKNSLPQLSLKRKQTKFPRVKITSSHQAEEVIRNFYGDDITIFESFFLLLLDQSHTTTGYVKISQGGITGTVVDVRIIAKYAVEGLATAVVIAHNHPAGTLRPSDTDIHITKKIQAALALFDIRILDHIILTETSFYSFSDEGLL